jgi:class 3 adenylate cyclase
MLQCVMSGSDLSENWKRLHRLAAEDWDYAKSLLSRANALTVSAATFEKIDQQLTRAASQEAFVAFGGAVADWDASDVADRVETPALVTHTPPAHHTPLEACRRLATTLPNGRFAPITEAEPQARLDALTRVIVGFVGDILPRSARETAPPAQQSLGTAVILFTDIADSTALTERHGDRAFRSSSRALDDAIRTAIRADGGIPVAGRVLGDGVMGTFQSAAHAIACARACLTAATAAGLELHVGLHAGDVIHEDGNVYGGAVNIASRVCGLSQPGEILVSGTVRDLARTSSQVAFDDRGEHPLKGVADSVQIFAVAPERAGDPAAGT